MYPLNRTNVQLNRDQKNLMMMVRWFRWHFFGGGGDQVNINYSTWNQQWQWHFKHLFNTFVSTFRCVTYQACMLNVQRKSNLRDLRPFFITFLAIPNKIRMPIHLKQLFEKSFYQQVSYVILSVNTYIFSPNSRVTQPSLHIPAWSSRLWQSYVNNSKIILFIW